MSKYYFNSLDFIWNYFGINPKLPDAKKYIPNDVRLPIMPKMVGLVRVPEPTEEPIIKEVNFVKDIVRINGRPYYCWRKIDND